MASGHVNRTQRPNTWLHRPSLRREDSPCQLGAVHTWPFATFRCNAMTCRFRGQSRLSRLFCPGELMSSRPNYSSGTRFEGGFDCSFYYFDVILLLVRLL